MAATGVAAFAAVLLAVGVFTHGGEDDAYITYWAARALGRYGSVVNYNGAPVEQSSSLTLVVLLGLLHAVTRIPVPWLGYAVGLGAFAANTSVAKAPRPDLLPAPSALGIRRFDAWPHFSRAPYFKERIFLSQRLRSAFSPPP